VNSSQVSKYKTHKIQKHKGTSFLHSTSMNAWTQNSSFHTSEDLAFACSAAFPGVCMTSFHCVSNCSSNFSELEIKGQKVKLTLSHIQMYHLCRFYHSYTLLIYSDVKLLRMYFFGSSDII